MELYSVGEQLIEQILELRKSVKIIEHTIENNKKYLQCQDCTTDFYENLKNQIAANEMSLMTKKDTIRSLERTYRKLNIEHTLDNKV